jgi:hypothetical protein
MNNLAEYLNFESSRRSPQSSADISRQAIHQLLESKLGAEMTLCAQRLAKNNDDGRRTSPRCSSSLSSLLLEEKVAELMDLPAYRQHVEAQIQECPLSLLFPSKQQLTVSEKSTVDSSTATIAKKKSAAAASSSTSFSLFDLMDSQKGVWFSTLPPRIMAQQVIDAQQQQQNQLQSDRNHNKSVLELLEQAEDMEDLSPDIDSWEKIRSILYRGLIMTNGNNNDETIPEEERRRYFKVHKSLFDKCLRCSNGGGVMFRSQSWALTFNIVGSILSFSNNIFDNAKKTDLDLYWDSCHHLLSSLSHLAKDYITSCVGNEKNIEKMILGLSLILCLDFPACVLAMMDSMAGWFEVWTRFVAPKSLLTIVRASGLGETVLRRCECRGGNESSKRLCELLHLRKDDSGCGESMQKLEDVENSTLLQSLSILRVILLRGNITSSERMGSVFASNVTMSFTSFLVVDGTLSSEEVQTVLAKTNDYMQSSSDTTHNEVTARIMEPFCHVIRLKESNPFLVDDDLVILCTQIISHIEQFCR